MVNGESSESILPFLELQFFGGLYNMWNQVIDIIWKGNLIHVHYSVKREPSGDNSDIFFFKSESPSPAARGVKEYVPKHISWYSYIRWVRNNFKNNHKLFNPVQ